MKMRIKAKVNNIGRAIMEVPENFNDKEVEEYILDHLEEIKWDEVLEKDVDYIILEDGIREEDDDEPEEEDNTYSGGIYR